MAKSKQDALKEQAERETIGQPDESPAAEVVAPKGTKAKPTQKSAMKVAKVVTTSQFQPINRAAVTQLDGEEIRGRVINGEEPDDVVTFLSENKGLIVFVPDYEIIDVDGEEQAVPIPTDNNKQSLKRIRFAQGMFRTNNPTTVHQLRTLEVQGRMYLDKVYFEGELPSWVLEKQKKYTEHFTRDPQEHELREGVY